MINFVNYKLEINDYVDENIENSILDFLKNKFDNLGLVQKIDINNYCFAISDEVNYSQLNNILTEFYNEFHFSLIFYKQIFIRKNNKN